MAALSEGYSIGSGSWAIPLAALPELKISLPVSAVGKTDVHVTLVGVDGAALVEAKVVLVIAARMTIPPTSPPVMQPEDRPRALMLVKKGDEELAEGRVATARLSYERAADMGLAQAALALAATYDAAELIHPHLRGVEPDAKEAKRWYERAHVLGAREAEQRLQRLGANR